MMKKIITISCISCFIFTACVSAVSVRAAMSSPTYKIPTDTINVGGGDSASANYGLRDTTGEVATGNSSSNTYKLAAGFWQMQEGFISISAAQDLGLTSINGLSGGESVSSNAWTVLTDNPAGYSLFIRASTAPALQAPGGLTFADYTPSGSDPDFLFTILPNQSLFGFTPEGVDILDRYKDNGTQCNTGGLDTSDRCWNGLQTTDSMIAQRASANQPSGTITTVKYKAAIGSAKLQESGGYSAVVTVTAVML